MNHSFSSNSLESMESDETSLSSHGKKNNSKKPFEGKNLEKKVEEMMRLMERTMDTWVRVINDVRDDQKKIDIRLQQMEKDIKFLKNKKVMEEEILQQQQRNSRLLMEKRQYEQQQQHQQHQYQQRQEIYQQENIGMDVENIDSFGSYTNNNTLKMASRYQIRESQTIQIPRESYEKIIHNQNQNQFPMFSSSSSSQMISSSTMLSSSSSTSSIGPVRPIQKTQSDSMLNYHSIPLMISNSDITGYKEIKLDNFDIPIETIRRYLETTCLSADIKLFKMMYIEGVPIRHIKKSFQYWLDNKMNEDIGGKYIRDTVCKNIEKLYTKVNTMNYYKDNNDKFLSNQEHIMKLSDEKYKDKLLQQIVTIIEM